MISIKRSQFQYILALSCLTSSIYNLLSHKFLFVESGTPAEDIQYSSEPDWLFYANYTAPRIQIGCLLATAFAHVIPATHIAALQINNGSQNILTNYSLIPLIRNTGSDLTNGGPTVANLADLVGLTGKPFKVQSIVGPVIPLHAQFASTIDAALGIKIPMLSPLVSSPILSNRQLYPRFARIVPSDSAQGSALAYLVQAFGWTRVATLSSTGTEGESIVGQFAITGKQLGITIINSQTFNPAAGFDIHLQLTALRNSGAYVILLAFTNVEAPAVFQQMIDVGLTGVPYTFIGVHQWFRTEAVLKDPSYAYILKGTVGTMIGGLDQAKFNKFAADWAALYSNPQFTPLFRGVAAPVLTSANVYDSIYFTAKTLNKLKNLQSYCNITDPNTLASTPIPYDTFYSDHCSLLQSIGPDSMLYNLMLNTTWDGITGTIKLNSNGERLGDFNIVNIRDVATLPVSIGYVNEGGKLFFNNSAIPDATPSTKPNFIIWADGTNNIPKDSVATIYQLDTINEGLFSTFIALAAIGIVFGLCLLAFNFIYRKHPLIKMSSPRINNVVIFGCLMGFIVIILVSLIDSPYVTDDSFPKLCHAELWLSTSAFTLAFGSLLSKTFRVHTIFNNPKLTAAPTVKDTHLFGLVGILIILDFIINISWSAFDPFTRQVIYGTGTLIGQTNVVPIRTQCSSKNYTAWQIVVYTYKGLLLAAGVVLAFKVRNVHIPALNDSKWIGICIYNITVIMVLLIPVSSSLGDKISAAVSMRAIAIFAMTALTLGILFVPKIYSLLTNTEGNWTKTQGTGVPGKPLGQPQMGSRVNDSHISAKRNSMDNPTSPGQRVSMNQSRTTTTDVPAAARKGSLQVPSKAFMEPDIRNSSANDSNPTAVRGKITPLQTNPQQMLKNSISTKYAVKPEENNDNNLEEANASPNSPARSPISPNAPSDSRAGLMKGITIHSSETEKK